LSIQNHIRELHPAYGMFESLDDNKQREAAAQLMDFLLAEQIAVPDPFRPAPGLLPSLRDAVKAAHPDRKCAAYILKNIAKWNHPAVIELLATLAPAIPDLGDDGMAMLLEAAGLEARTVPAVAAYAMTNKAIIRAAVALALHAARNGQIAYLQRLTAACPAAKMEESKDAERLFPAVAAVPDALGLAAAITVLNISSARGTCLRLAKIARTPEYLADFQLLVESVGIQSIGFCLESLPGLYAKHGVERTRAFAAMAAEAAREYGSYAGQAFLERKTAAARAAL
jgi:hypothetical protein